LKAVRDERWSASSRSTLRGVQNPLAQLSPFDIKRLGKEERRKYPPLNSVILLADSQVLDELCGAPEHIYWVWPIGQEASRFDIFPEGVNRWQSRAHRQGVDILTAQAKPGAALSETSVALR
jgi:hypothetical protein